MRSHREAQAERDAHRRGPRLGSASFTDFDTAREIVKSGFRVLASLQA
jgi:hypothetical protein